ncbi:hypothetical protein VNO77_33669 [Canavalia gladiata]|uniref:F-box domain-containing protein n=1 Tax=Canavalia gladiata TaxID=3824 RepID=A0AAN9PYJ6_CANGL
MHDETELKMDIISTLPNCILLYIMSFMTTKEAIQTCVLSKRWKDLWKYLPTLIASNMHFQKDSFFKNFVVNVLLHRDHSSALRNISVEHKGYGPPQLLAKLVKYATSHYVEQLKIDTFVYARAKRRIVFSRSMFSSHSLKYLDISFRDSSRTITLPKTLNLPMLIECHLKDVAFSSGRNRAKPFSGCKQLKTLVINNCTLENAQTLCIFNDSLSNLTIWFGILFDHSYKVKISAPNLKSFTFVSCLNASNTTHQLFKNNLEFLEEARIEVLCSKVSLKIANTLKSWLKKLSNVKSLTLCSETLKVLSSISNFPNIESLRFGNLMSLVVKCERAKPVPYEGLKYMLQDSPLEEATVIEAMPSYYDELQFVFEPTEMIYRKKFPLLR